MRLYAYHASNITADQRTQLQHSGGRLQPSRCSDIPRPLTRGATSPYRRRFATGGAGERAALSGSF